MKKRFLAFSVFLLIVLSCFSFLYMFPVLGSDSVKTTPSLKFKSWQIGRSAKGTDKSKSDQVSFITSTQTLCSFTASVGYGAIPDKENTSPIDPNTVKWSVVDASHKMKLDKKSIDKNWSGSSPSVMAADTSFNVVASLTVPKVVGTRTVETDNGTKQVPDYIGSTSCSHSEDKDRLKRTPVHRDGKKMKFKLKFSAQTEAKQQVSVVLELAADDKDQIRQEYVDYNRPIPSRDDDKWSDEDTYDFGYYDTMMNDGLGGYLKKWVGEINKLRGTYKDTGKRVPEFKVSDFVVTSGYRNPHHNFDHSGSTALLSAHMYGYALDVRGKALVDTNRVLDIDGDRKNTDKDRDLMIRAARPNASARKSYKYPAKHVHADWAPANWASRSSKAGDAPVFKLPKAGVESSSSQLDISPTTGVYTAEVGQVHTSSVSASVSLYGVNWYVASPGETGLGTYVEHDGGGSGVTTASLNYTFLSSGDYVITAVAYNNSDMSKLGEASYTVSVTAPSLSYSLVSSDGVYTATAGTGHESNFTTNEAYTYVYWYVKSPGDTSSYGTNVRTESGDGSKMTSQLDYSFPSGVSGDYQFLAYVYSSGGSVYETSYTVSVSLPAVSAPVWRDIPDPDNLTVGDYFYLVLSNYVSGSPSPTLTWDSGTQPAGTTFSDGMLMGEVTQVESCYFRVKATNSAGSAYSEWISITISAPVWKPKKPDAPTGLSVSAGTTAGTVDFSWTAPADNGSPITDYKVAYGSYNNGWGGWTPYTSIGSTSTSYTVTGLESGRTYRLRVRAVNSLGDGRFSRYAQITVP